MKSVEDIRFLLDKFYDGTSTREEEAVLHAFFCESEDLPEDLLADRELFAELAVVGGEAEDIPDGLCDDLAAVIDKAAGKDVEQKQWWTWRRIAGIAASICVVASVGIYLLGKPSDEQYVMVTYGNHVYVPQTEEAAIAETSRALMLLAEKMEAANRRVEYTSEKLQNENQ